MTILVTGATGQVGSQVLAQLARRGAEVRALSRDPGQATLPDGVVVVRGEMLDVEAMRAALKDVTTLFLLNAVSSDEFTQALTVLRLAREAGIDRLVYLSAINSDHYFDVPHMAGKFAVERMIKECGIHASILRPAYYMNTDASAKATVLEHGIYPMPVGNQGVAMIDVRDIGEIAAIELLRRENADRPLPTETLNLVGPDTLTGKDIAAIWSAALGRAISDAAATPADFERSILQHGPSWLAYDMRGMAERIHREGMKAKTGDIERLMMMLGRPLRTYRAFVAEIIGDPAIGSGSRSLGERSPS